MTSRHWPGLTKDMISAVEALLPDHADEFVCFGKDIHYQTQQRTLTGVVIGCLLIKGLIFGSEYMLTRKK